MESSARVSVRRNVIANYAGQAWRGLMNLAFVPFYIKYLGMEAYGLIGIFALLQVWLGVLDIGMKPALGREMARFTAGARDAGSIRDLLRTVEVAAVGIAAATAAAIWVLSTWLATHWITATHLSANLIAQAFAIMGLVAALRFVEDIYVSSLAGLQQQSLQNTATAVMSTLRSAGAVPVLIWVSRTVKAFFMWQALVSVVSVVVFSVIVHRALPQARHRARFSAESLKSVRRFATGIVTITFLSLLLNQVDKILLSRLLTLETFGTYALAGVAANTLYVLTGPITSAFYPRFTQLSTSGDQRALAAAYHQGAQLVTVLMGSAATVLIANGEQILRLWTGNASLAKGLAPIMTTMVLGTLFNCLLAIPYQMQLAHGWTSLTVKFHVVAVTLLVPALWLIVPTYGQIGAARVWLGMNTCYLLFIIPLMHRRILPAEKVAWWSRDVAAPLAAAVAVVLFSRQFVPRALSKVGEFEMLALVSAAVLLTTALSAPSVRCQLVGGILNPARTTLQSLMAFRGTSSPGK